MKIKGKLRQSSLAILCFLWLYGKASYWIYGKLVSSYKVNNIAGRAGIPKEILAGGAILAGCIVLIYPCCKAISFVISFISRQLERVNCGQLLLSKQICIFLRLMAAAGFLLLVWCSFQPDVWLDEAFSMRMTGYSYREMIQFTARDVHPPLYYIMLKFVLDIFRNLSEDFSVLVTAAKLFSVLSYILIMILCQRWLNEEGALLNELLPLCLFCGSNLIGYGIEIRMYGWAMFFVTATYLFARDVMNGRGKKKTWILLIIFSLCSAYTHCFALISAAMIWIWLLVLIVRNGRNQLKMWLFSGGVVFAGYIPWLFVLVRQARAVSKEYWILTSDMPGILDCIEFLFPGFLVFAVMIIAAHVIMNGGGEKRQFWDFTGFLVWGSTILIGWLMSVLFRPVFISRYLIPCGFCVWISVLLIWKRVSDKQQLVIAGLVIAGCIVSGYQLFCRENLSGRQAEEALSLIDAMTEDSVIFVEGKTSDHVLYTAAVYTDNKVYYGGENAENDVFLEVFDNVELVEEGEEAMETLLSRGVSVYYMTTNSSADIITIGNENTGVFLGEYLFGIHTFVYEVTAGQE